MKDGMAYAFERLKIKKMIILFVFMFLYIGVHAEDSITGTNTGQKLSDAVPGLSCVVDLWPNISITADRKNSIFQSYSLFVRGTVEYKYNAELFLFKTVYDKEINLMLRQMQFDGSLGTVMNDNTFKQQVDELYIMYGEEDGTHVSLGKKVVRWGQFEYYQQGNFIGPHKDPLDDTAPLEGYIMAEAAVNMFWDKVKWQSAFLPRMPQDKPVEYYSDLGKYDIVSRLLLDIGFLGVAAQAGIADIINCSTGDLGRIYKENFEFGVDGYVVLFDVFKLYGGYKRDNSNLHRYKQGREIGFNVRIFDNIYVIFESYMEDYRAREYDALYKGAETAKLEWSEFLGFEKMKIDFIRMFYYNEPWKESMAVDVNYELSDIHMMLRNMFEISEDKNDYIIELRLQTKI